MVTDQSDDTEEKSEGGQMGDHMEEGFRSHLGDSYDEAVTPQQPGGGEAKQQQQETENVFPKETSQHGSIMAQIIQTNMFVSPSI